MDGIYRVFCFPYTLVYIREIFQQNRQKTGYVELNIEQSYCKLTLKASEDVLPGNNRFFKLSVFIFFFFFVSCHSRAQKAIGVLLRKFPSCIIIFLYRIAGNQSNIIFNVHQKVFVVHGDSAL